MRAESSDWQERANQLGDLFVFNGITNWPEFSCLQSFRSSDTIQASVFRFSEQQNSQPRCSPNEDGSLATIYRILVE